MELILRWDVCDQVLAQLRINATAQTRGRLVMASMLTVFEEITIASPWRRRRPAQTARNMEFIGSIGSNGIKLEQIMS